VSSPADVPCGRPWWPSRDARICLDAGAQTHRLLRRGIAFGKPFKRSAHPGSPHAGNARYPHDRGLLFLCYQASIERQFEFVQSKWVNAPDFPQGGDGHDPIISQVDGTRSFALPGGTRTTSN
jgi:deferrochelatase/peroxidase EfeB